MMMVHLVNNTLVARSENTEFLPTGVGVFTQAGDVAAVT